MEFLIQPLEIGRELELADVQIYVDYKCTTNTNCPCGGSQGTC